MNDELDITQNNKLLDVGNYVIVQMRKEFYNRKPDIAIPPQVAVYKYDLLRTHVLVSVFLSLALIFTVIQKFFAKLESLLPILAILGGLGAALLLVYEALTTEKGTIAKIGLYTASFLLIFEVIVIVVKLLGY